MRKVFWIYLVLMGLVMVWYIPPFQKADEIVHFQNSIVIVGGRSWVIQNRFVELADKIKSSDVAFKSEKRFNSSRLWESDSNKSIVDFGYLIDWKSYISYFPVEIGVWIGSLTQYPVLALYFGRMMGLILFLFCVWLSLKLIPMKYSGLVIAYSVVPMVLHQVTEVSYDVSLLCLAPLVLAVFLKTLRQAQGKLWKWFGILSFLILMFILVKSAYYFMLLLLPIILWIKYKKVLVDKPWIVLIVVLSLIPVVIFFVKFLLNNVAGGTNNLVHGQFQMEILKHDPIQILRIFSETWIVQRDFYIKSMLGYFGWLDYQFDVYQYLLVFGVIVAFVVNVINKIKKPVFGWIGLLITWLIIVGTYVLIEIGFLMQWTPVGSIVIEGVQGRYLLPLVPLLFFWITQFFVTIGKKSARIVAFSMVGFFIVSGMVGKIYYRYYDLSNNFRNVGELEKQIKEADEQKLDKTFLSSKNKLTVNFHTSDGDVLGGFELLINRKDNLIIVPYRYSIKDRECSRELAWGYFDNSKLNKENVYSQNFDALKLGYRDICFEIEPVVTDSKQSYFDYVLIDDEPLVKLKFLTNEVN